MLSKNEILETIDMLDTQHLDIRTVTLALSLFDCIDSDADVCAQKVYDKVAKKAEKLVPTCEKLSQTYGVPIVNKRIAVTPVSLIGAPSGGYLKIAKALDRAAIATGVDFVGGYTALLQKGITDSEREFLRDLPAAVTQTKRLCASVNVASTKAGINLDAIKTMGEIIKYTAFLSRNDNCFGCAKTVVFANAVEDNPFMAGAFTGTGEGDCTINVGVSGPGTVEAAIAKLGDTASINEVCETIKKTAFKITRLGQLIAKRAADTLGYTAGIVDLSLAPTPTVGDSVARVLERIGLASVGAAGTTACLALLNDAVKKGGLMASDSVGGLSGAFIPVSEDEGMIDAVRRGALSIEKLEAMTAVCSVGLDMIAIPGDTDARVISAIIADECAIGVVNNKTTAVRVMPVYNKKVGDEVSLGGLWGTAPVMDVSEYSPSKFIDRGGHIPAPVHSNKN